jgi:putative redox protein
MAVDVRMILEKSRVPVETLEVRIEGDRAETEPRKFEAIRLTYLLTGPGEEHQSKLDRAVQLSKDKYCSVLHSLDPAIAIDVRVERA